MVFGPWYFDVLIDVISIYRRKYVIRGKEDSNDTSIREYLCNMCLGLEGKAP